MPGRLAILVLAMVSSVGSNFLLGETTMSPYLQSLVAPHLNEADELRLIGRIRAMPRSQDEAKIWRDIANSPKYSGVRRGHRLVKLLDRYIHPGMALRELATVLGGAAWLKDDDFTHVSVYTTIGGSMPISIVNGETVFIIRLHRWLDSSAVYLHMQGTPSGDSIYDALKEKKSVASTLKITAIAIFCPGADDRPLVTHSKEWDGKERLN